MKEAHVLGIEGNPGRWSREALIGLGGMGAAALAVGVNHAGPLLVLGARTAQGEPPPAAAGYGPLVPTFYVNQQGERLGENEPPGGTPQTRAGSNHKDLDNGPIT